MLSTFRSFLSKHSISSRLHRYAGRTHPLTSLSTFGKGTKSNNNARIDNKAAHFTVQLFELSKSRTKLSRGSAEWSNIEAKLIKHHAEISKSWKISRSVLYNLATIGYSVPTDLSVTTNIIGKLAGSVFRETPSLVAAATENTSYHKDATIAISNLGRLGYQLVNLPMDVQLSMFFTIAVGGQHFNDINLINVVDGLHCMGAKVKDLPTEVKETLFTLIAKLNAEESTITASGVDALLSALARMDVKFHAFPRESKQSLFALLESRVTSMSGSTLASSFYSLGVMEAKYSELPFAYRSAVFQLLRQVAVKKANINPKDMTNILVSLSRMDVILKGLSVADRESLLRSLQVKATALNPHGLANAIHSLGKMEAEWTSLPKDLQLALIARIVKVEKEGTMKAGDISSILNGLANLKAKFTKLPKEGEQSIMKIVECQMANFNEQDMGLSIYSLGLMGAEYVQLPSSLLSALDVQLQKLQKEDTMTAQNISSTLHGLAKMKAKFADLSEDGRESLLSILQSKASLLADQNISMSFYSLGIMGVGYTKLPLDLKSALFARLQQLEKKKDSSLNPQGIANLLYGLAKMKAKFVELPEDTQQSLQNILFSKNSSMNDHAISSAIYSLDLMELDCVKMTEALRSALLARLLELAREDNKTAHDLANLLYGLAKMNAKLAELSEDVRQNLLEALQSKASSLDHDNLARSLFSLGTLGAEYSQLSSTLREALFARLQELENQGTMSAQNISNTLHGLAKMKAKFSELPEDGRQSLLSILQSRANSLAEQEIAMSYYSLGLMEVEYAELPSALRTALLARLQQLGKKKDGMTSQSMANILYGLAKMNAKFAEFSGVAKDSLLIALQNCASSLTKPSIAMTYYSLGVMEVNYAQLPGILRSSLLTRLAELENVDSMSAQGIANTLYGLAKMEATFVDLPRDARHNLLKILRGRASLLTEQEIAMSYYSLGLMEVDYTKLNVSLRSGLLARLQELKKDDSITEQAISNILYGMAKMGAKFVELPEDTKESLLQILLSKASTLNEQGMTMSLYSFGLMEVAYTELSLPLRSSIFGRLQELGEQDGITAVSISNALYGLAKMKAKFVELPELDKQTLLQILQKTASSLDEQNIANCIYSLGMMEVDYNKDLSGVLRTALFDRLLALEKEDTIAEQEIANTFYDQVKLHAKSTELTEDVIMQSLRQLLQDQTDSLNEQVAAKSIKSLALMKVDHTKQALSLRSSTFARLQELTKEDSIAEQGIVKTMSGLAKLKAKLAELSENTKQSLLQVLLSRISTSTDQQSKNNSTNSLGTTDVAATAVAALAVVEQPVNIPLLICLVELVIREEKTVKNISNIFHGLAKMQVNFADLPEDVRQCLLTMLSQRATALSDIQAKNVADSLQKLEVIIPTDIKETLMRKFGTDNEKKE